MSAASGGGLTARLGDLLASLPSLPRSLEHEGKRALLNGLGTALGSARDPAVARIAGVMRRLGGDGPATLIGRPERLRPAEAAFVNAIGMNLLDFDDTHLPTVIHPTAPVAPVALALGEDLGSSGREVLTAFVLGAEIACRVGLMVSPGHYARGWHITSTCGVFGAAAAAAKLLRLDATRSAHALGIAASLSAGLVENLPTAGKNAGVGNAARNGVLAAFLADTGLEAAPTALDGRLGWARACGDEPDVDRALRGLGESWEFAQNSYKPYPAGVVFHALIDACLEVRRSGGLVPADIAAVTVRGDALFMARGDRETRTAGDARVSFRHIAAVALLFGSAGPREFEDPCVRAPAVAALRDRVTGRLDPTLQPGAAGIRVHLADGRVLETTVEAGLGSRERPLTDAAIDIKVRRLAAEGRTGCDVEAVAAAVWRLEDLGDARDLTRLLRPPDGGAGRA